jgi:aspartate kinase
VSVSVTIDDRRSLPMIIEQLEQVGEVTREDDMAIVCAVGEGLQNDPTFVGELLHAIGDVPLRMVSQAASRRNITFVIRAADLTRTLARVHDRFFAKSLVVQNSELGIQN